MSALYSQPLSRRRVPPRGYNPYGQPTPQFSNPQSVQSQLQGPLQGQPFTSISDNSLATTPEGSADVNASPVQGSAIPTDPINFDTSGLGNVPPPSGGGAPPASQGGYMQGPNGPKPQGGLPSAQPQGQPQKQGTNPQTGLPWGRYPGMTAGEQAWRSDQAVAAGPVQGQPPPQQHGWLPPSSQPQQSGYYQQRPPQGSYQRPQQNYQYPSRGPQQGGYQQQPQGGYQQQPQQQNYPQQNNRGYNSYNGGGGYQQQPQQGQGGYGQSRSNYQTQQPQQQPNYNQQQRSSYGGGGGGYQQRPNQPASYNGGGRQSPGTGYERGGIPGFAGGGIAVGAPPSQQQTMPAGAFNPGNQRDVFNQNQDLLKSAVDNQDIGQSTENQNADYYMGIENQGLGLTNNLYKDIWNGGGGYTDQESSDVKNQGGLDEIRSQLDNNYLTPGEQTAISGDPYSAKNMFNDYSKSLTAGTAADAQNLEAQASHGADLGNAVVDQYGRDLSGAIDPTKMSLSAGFKPGLDSRLSQGQAGLTAAEGNADLTPTDQYKQQAGMTDAEVAQAAAAGQRGVAAQYGSMKDKLIADTQAAGGGSPMQIASALGAFNRTQAASEADASVNAQLAARQQQRDAATGVQNTVGQMGQYRSSLGAQDALSQEGAGIAADTTAEQMRLGAQQGLTASQIQAAQLKNTAALNNTQYNTASALGAATQAGNWNQQTGQYEATTGTNLDAAAEANASARAGQIAGNRQTVSQGNQATEYNLNNAASTRAVQAAAPRVAAQVEGRAAGQNLMNYGGTQANVAKGLGLQAGSVYGGQAQGAANTYAQYGENETNNGGVNGAIRNTASLINAIKARGGPIGEGSGIGDENPYSNGGIINKDQLIEVGEHDRPEAILPLDPATPPEHRNMWEHMGAHLGKRLGVHHNHRPYNPSPTIAEKLGTPTEHFGLGGLAGSMVGVDTSSLADLTPGSAALKAADEWLSQPSQAPGPAPTAPGGPGQVSSAPVTMPTPSGPIATPQSAPAPTPPSAPNMTAPSGPGLPGAAPSSLAMAPPPTLGSAGMQIPPSAGGLGQQGGPTPPYQRPKSIFDLDSANPFIANQVAQAQAMRPQPQAGMARGGLLPQKHNRWKAPIPPGMNLPRLREYTGHF